MDIWLGRHIFWFMLYYGLGTHLKARFLADNSITIAVFQQYIIAMTPENYQGLVQGYNIGFLKSLHKQ